MQARNPVDRPVVSIVDPDTEARDSLALLMRSSGWLVECFASAEEFLARPRVVQAGCLVLDVALPQLDGLALQELIADRRETPVIFVTSRSDICATVRAMKAGAVDFLTKPIHDASVLCAVRAALVRSARAIASEASLRLLRDRHATLSPREHDVFIRVVAGLLNKQVAAELGISEITVKAHRGRVMRKMEADSLADLVNMSMRLGFAASSRRSMRWIEPVESAANFTATLFGVTAIGMASSR